METKEANNGWFLAGDDPELKKDLQKKYEWFLRVLYRCLWQLKNRSLGSLKIQSVYWGLGV